MPVGHERDIHSRWEFGKTAEIGGLFGNMRLDELQQLIGHVLAAGDHVVEVKAAKFGDWKPTVSVSEGSDLNVTAALQPQ